MSQTSLVYWSDKFGKNIARCDSFFYQITGAKTVAKIVPGQPGLTAFDAISQALLDAELSTDEVAAAKFDATAMGDDMFALVCNFGGQIQKLVAVELQMLGSANLDQLAMVTQIDSGLTDSTAATEATVTSEGNLACRFLVDDLVDGVTTLDFDGATAGIIKINVYWISK